MSASSCGFLFPSSGCAIALIIPTRVYMDLAVPGYAVCILLLIAALVFGREVGGARSWIYIGPYGFQSSELTKVGTLLAVARLLTARRHISRLRTTLTAVGLVLLPAMLIVMQNDTGTALVFLALIPILLFWTGTSPWHVMLIIMPVIIAYSAIFSLPLAIALSVAVFVYYAWRRRSREAIIAGVVNGGTVAAVFFALSSVLAPHQVARINAFANPDAAEFRHGVGFHLMQSKAAIGSGGFSGQGYMQGTQTQGAYIPEQSTDFIFSVIGEELGFLGSILVLVFFAVLLMRLVRMAHNMDHRFGSVVAAGTAGMILIQVCINVGMVLGLLPVIGIPLPLISYGGSALLANTGLLAMVFSMYMRHTLLREEHL